jgi:hypothetical protein
MGTDEVGSMLGDRSFGFLGGSALRLIMWAGRKASLPMLVTPGMVVKATLLLLLTWGNKRRTFGEGLGLSTTNAPRCRWISFICELLMRGSGTPESLSLRAAID